MGKQVSTQLQFHGGLNQGADSRDIKNEEFQDVVDANLNQIGVIKLIGSFIEHEATSGSVTGENDTENTVAAGAGLFHMKTDIKVLNGSGTMFDGTADAAGKSDILLIVDEDGSRNVSIFQNSGGSLVWCDDASAIRLGSSTTCKPVYYSADGALRIGDANRTAGNTTQWLGPIAPKVYGPDTPVAAGGTTLYTAFGNYFTRHEASVYRTSAYEGTDGVGGTYENYQQLPAAISGAFPTVTLADGTVVCDNAMMITTVADIFYGGYSWPRVSAGGSPNTLSYNVNYSTSGRDRIACESGENRFRYFKVGMIVRCVGWDHAAHNDQSIITHTDDDWIEFTTNGGSDQIGEVNPSTQVRGWMAPNQTGGAALANENCAIGNTHTGKNTQVYQQSDRYWGFQLSYREGETNSGTWMPTSSTRYKFYITTMYDDGIQESLPQLLAQYSSFGLRPKYTGTTFAFEDNVADELGNTGDAIYDSAGKILHNGFSIGQTILFEGFTSTVYNNTNGTAVTIRDVDKYRIYFAALHGSSVDEAEGDEVTIEVEEDFVYTNTDFQDPYPVLGSENSFHLSHSQKLAEPEIPFCNWKTLGTPGTNVRVWFAPKFKINGAVAGDVDANAQPAYSNCYVFGDDSSGSDREYGNPRISGCKIYWASNEDGYSTLWEIMDCDFARGCKALGMDGGSGESGYAPWKIRSDFPNSSDSGAESPTSNVPGHYMAPDFNDLSSNRWIHPPRYRTYFTNNLHSHSDTIDVDYFKTAVIANGRCYLGNVTQTVEGVQEHHEDRILKSPVGQYDKFPHTMILESATNDGDEIIHLATFADRLLQFGKHRVYIINISQDTEYIEDKHEFKGVETSGAVATTANGVTWANKYGVYHYDGKEIQDLFVKQGMEVIDNTTWQLFLGNPIVGYHPDTKQLFVVDDSAAAKDGKCYIYNFITQSWSKSSTLADDAIKSNIINDYNGDLIYYKYDTSGGLGVMKKWSNTAVNNTTLNLEFKDEDFGEPSIRKKIYKVYITYKCASDTNVKAIYGTNGKSSFDYDFATGNNYAENNLQGTASQWAQAELVPDDKTEANNIYSFQLKLYATGAVPSSFEINDISIIYRKKPVK